MKAFLLIGALLASTGVGIAAEAGAEHMGSGAGAGIGAAMIGGGGAIGPKEKVPPPEKPSKGTDTTEKGKDPNSGGDKKGRGDSGPATKVDISKEGTAKAKGN